MSYFANGSEMATEWSDGSVIDLGPGIAFDINDAGQIVGDGSSGATEWSGGNAFSLAGLPGSTSSEAHGINAAGQVVGSSSFGNSGADATEWSDGSVIDLGGLPGFIGSFAYGINDAGHVVGSSRFILHGIPESSTWAMMLLGFAGLGLAGYRRAKSGDATFARDGSAVG